MHIKTPLLLKILHTGCVFHAQQLSETMGAIIYVHGLKGWSCTSSAEEEEEEWLLVHVWRQRKMISFTDNVKGLPQFALLVNPSIWTHKK